MVAATAANQTQVLGDIAYRSVESSPGVFAWIRDSSEDVGASGIGALASPSATETASTAEVASEVTRLDAAINNVNTPNLSDVQLQSATDATFGSVSGESVNALFASRRASTADVNAGTADRLVDAARLREALAAISTSFQSLTDTPNDLATIAEQVLRVNAAGNGIEAVELAAGIVAYDNGVTNLGGNPATTQAAIVSLKALIDGQPSQLYVDTVPDRDAVPSPVTGSIVHVSDASAGTTIGTGWAKYTWNGTDWEKYLSFEDLTSVDVLSDAQIQSLTDTNVGSISGKLLGDREAAIQGDFVNRLDQPTPWTGNNLLGRFASRYSGPGTNGEYPTLAAAATALTAANAGDFAFITDPQDATNLVQVIKHPDGSVEATGEITAWYANRAAFPAIGNDQRIYGDIAENELYRWDATGGDYVRILNEDLQAVTDLATLLNIDFTRKRISHIDIITQGHISSFTRASLITVWDQDGVAYPASAWQNGSGSPLPIDMAPGLNSQRVNRIYYRGSVTANGASRFRVDLRADQPSTSVTRIQVAYTDGTTQQLNQPFVGVQGPRFYNITPSWDFTSLATPYIGNPFGSIDSPAAAEVASTQDIVDALALKADLTFDQGTPWEAGKPDGYQLNDLVAYSGPDATDGLYAREADPGVAEGATFNQAQWRFLGTGDQSANLFDNSTPYVQGSGVAIPAGGVVTYGGDATYDPGLYQANAEITAPLPAFDGTQFTYQGRVGPFDIAKTIANGGVESIDAFEMTSGVTSLRFRVRDGETGFLTKTGDGSTLILDDPNALLSRQESGTVTTVTLTGPVTAVVTFDGTSHTVEPLAAATTVAVSSLPGELPRIDQVLPRTNVVSGLAVNPNGLDGQTILVTDAGTLTVEKYESGAVESSTTVPTGSEYVYRRTPGYWKHDGTTEVSFDPSNTVPEWRPNGGYGTDTDRRSKVIGPTDGLIYLAQVAAVPSNTNPETDDGTNWLPAVAGSNTPDTGLPVTDSSATGTVGTGGATISLTVPESGTYDVYLTVGDPIDLPDSNGSAVHTITGSQSGVVLSETRFVASNNGFAFNISRPSIALTANETLTVATQQFGAGNYNHIGCRLLIRRTDISGFAMPNVITMGSEVGTIESTGTATVDGNEYVMSTAGQVKLFGTTSFQAGGGQVADARAEIEVLVNDAPVQTLTTDELRVNYGGASNQSSGSTWFGGQSVTATVSVQANDRVKLRLTNFGVGDTSVSWNTNAVKLAYRLDVPV